MFEELDKYKSLGLFARQVVEGFITGLHKSPFHGFSVEFAEHRQYNSGESTRHIDWKLFARTDKLFVKRYEEETNLRCHIIIDHSSSMYYPLERQGQLPHPNKLTFAVYGAALLVELLLRQRDAFGLTLFSDQVDLQTDVRGSVAHQHYLYNILEGMLHPVEVGKLEKRGTEITQNLHLMAERMHRRSMVAIFTDALIDKEHSGMLFDALRHLRHCKHEVMLFHTLDTSHEVNFEFGSQPLLLIDMESDRRLKVFPHQVAAAYRSEMQRQTEELRQHAMRYRIDYIPVDVAKGFEQVMLPYLLKRGKHL
ncbi:MAG: DUF58 domain-containing protein [Bacteroidales bacterium]|nr:DUF58 domain-containing protein [Bacteroidales bacterium]